MMEEDAMAAAEVEATVAGAALQAEEFGDKNDVDFFEEYDDKNDKADIEGEEYAMQMLLGLANYRH